MNSDILEVNEPDVPGLYYIDNVFNDTDETIKALDICTWVPLTNSRNSRLVQHYGFKYNYTTYQINEPCDPIPPFLIKYRELLHDICLQLDLINSSYQFNQCIVNNYTQGQGISAHIDVKKYGGVIGCFTIGCGATMIFEKDDVTKEIYVKPNSLYIMSEDARYIWKHSMVGRKTDIVDNIKMDRGRRISITFRNVPI